MINDPQCDDLIAWSENGQSFIIMDPTKFSQELSKYFKHNNLSSFIRQLNMYGFRKVAAIENSGLHPMSEDLHFYHSDFVRDRPDKLEAIKRKLPQKIADTIDLRNVIRGINDIEGRQNDVTKTLTEIKRENEMLWSELADLRDKHQQQQLYISRLMKLVFEAMEQNGIKTNMLPVKRNSPLMIQGIEGTSSDHNFTSNADLGQAMNSDSNLPSGGDQPMIPDTDINSFGDQPLITNTDLGSVVDQPLITNTDLSSVVDQPLVPDNDPYKTVATNIETNSEEIDRILLDFAQDDGQASFDVNESLKYFD